MFNSGGGGATGPLLPRNKPYNLKHLGSKLSSGGLFQLVTGSGTGLQSQIISEELKLFCDSMNLTQLVNSPTGPDLRSTEESSTFDLILTNASH